MGRARSNSKRGDAERTQAPIKAEPNETEPKKTEERLHRFSWLFTALIGAVVGIGGSFLTFIQSSNTLRESNRIRERELEQNYQLKRIEVVNQLIPHLGHDTAETHRLTLEAIKQLGINPSEVRAPVEHTDSTPVRPLGGLVGLFRDLDGVLWAGGPCGAGQQCARIVIVNEPETSEPGPAPH